MDVDCTVVSHLEHWDFHCQEKPVPFSLFRPSCHFYRRNRNEKRVAKGGEGWSGKVRAIFRFGICCSDSDPNSEIHITFPDLFSFQHPIHTSQASINSSGLKPLVAAISWFYRLVPNVIYHYAYYHSVAKMGKMWWNGTWYLNLMYLLLLFLRWQVESSHSVNKDKHRVSWQGGT